MSHGVWLRAGDTSTNYAGGERPRIIVWLGTNQPMNVFVFGFMVNHEALACPCQSLMVIMYLTLYGSSESILNRGWWRKCRIHMNPWLILIDAGVSPSCSGPHLSFQELVVSYCQASHMTPSSFKGRDPIAAFTQALCQVGPVLLLRSKYPRGLSLRCTGAPGEVHQRQQMVVIIVFYWHQFFTTFF